MATVRAVLDFVTPRGASPDAGLHPNAVILRHAHLVERIAYGMLRHMPGNVEVDDLIQSGMIGLLEAAQRYRPLGEARFTTFVSHRIRGAMLDSLRAMDWGPRALRGQLRQIHAARTRIEMATGGAATPLAISKSLGLTLEAYHKALRDLETSTVVSLEEQSVLHAGHGGSEPIDEREGPAEILERQDLMDMLRRTITTLAEREREVLSLYCDGLLLREIGVALAMSESRACQILKQAVKQLRRAAAPRPRSPRFAPRPCSPISRRPSDRFPRPRAPARSG